VTSWTAGDVMDSLWRHGQLVTSWTACDVIRTCRHAARSKRAVLNSLMNPVVNRPHRLVFGVRPNRSTAYPVTARLKRDPN